MVETVDATLDAEGRVLTSAVHGTVEVNSRLSGMPDVSLSMSNSHLIEEYSFHPSVRLSRFAADRVVILLFIFVWASRLTSCFVNRFRLCRRMASSR